MRERSAYLDNVKGVLILLVVFGHVLWAGRSGEDVGYVVKMIYAFHMPAFVFISGYLSRADRGVPWRGIVFLLLVYAVANTVLMAYSVLVMGRGVVLMKPYYSCWYLLALAAWRILLPLVARMRGVAVASVLLALAVGCCDAVDNTFAIARTIAFFPFFIGGYLVKEKGWVSAIRERLRPVGSSVLGLVLLCLGLLIAHLSIRQLGLTTSSELMQAYGNADLRGMGLRALVFLIGGMATMGLVVGMPDVQVPFLTTAGRNSLTIFAFHRVPTLAVSAVLPIASLGVGQLACSLAVTAAIALVLGNNVVERGFRSGVTRAVAALPGVGERSAGTDALLWALTVLFLVVFMADVAIGG